MTTATEYRPTTKPARVRPSALSALVVAVPTTLALVLSLVWSGRPSYWLDETATVSAVDRPFPDLLRALKHIDAVHGAYYALLWPWAQVSTGEVWLRSTSALAAAGGTAAVVGIAWQLYGRRAAAVSGVLYATLPLVSYDGSNVRSESLDVLLVGTATFAFLRAVITGSRRWLVAYSLIMAAGITIFLFSALLLVAHLALVWANPRRRESLMALVLPAAATLVVGALTFGQAGQVSQIQRPTVRGLPRFVAEAWFSDSIGLTVLLGALAVAGLVSTARHRTRIPGGGLMLMLVLVAPSGLLWLVSQVRPVLVDRYVAAGAIPIAIFAGSVIALIRWRAIAALAVAAVLALGLPAQLAQRQPNGRGADYRDDPRAALSVVATERRSGDVIAYDGGYTQGAGYAYANLVAGLPDITLGASRTEAQNLYGTPATISQFRRRLVGVRRVWFVNYTSRSGPGGAPLVQVLQQAGFHRDLHRDYGRTSLSLYERGPEDQRSSAAQ